MNFDWFQNVFQETQFDEIHIIGRDIALDGLQVHIVSLAKKEDTMYLYSVEEAARDFDEMKTVEPKRDSEMTNRERMARYAGGSQKSFLHTRKIKIGGCVLEMQGGNAGYLEDASYAETYCFFVRMAQQGWKLSEQSYFYEKDWKQLSLVRHTVCAPSCPIPEMSGTESMEITFGTTCRQQRLQVPVRLEAGMQQQFTFTDDNGEEAVCYINTVKLVDELRETRELFASDEYRRKMLEHCTEEQLAEMTQSVLETLEQECPEGMRFVTIEYECTSDVSLAFYAREYLDAVPVPKNQAKALLMNVRPEQEQGVHGLKNRAAIIQYAVPADTKYLDVELCEALRAIPGKVYTI